MSKNVARFSISKPEVYMLERFRVWLAKILVKGTECAIGRRSSLEWLLIRSHDLGAYVRTSGGLNDPHRIKAYKQCLRLAGQIEQGSRNLLVGTEIETTFEVDNLRERKEAEESVSSLAVGGN